MPFCRVVIVSFALRAHLENQASKPDLSLLINP